MLVIVHQIKNGKNIYVKLCITSGLRHYRGAAADKRLIQTKMVLLW